MKTYSNNIKTGVSFRNPGEQVLNMKLVKKTQKVRKNIKM
jgi:hypothetical protein